MTMAYRSSPATSTALTARRVSRVGPTRYSSYVPTIARMMMILAATVILMATITTAQAEETTCEFDGVVYQINEPIPFQTRCGTTSDYPCYCAPDTYNGVYCPYCGHALADDSLRCLKDGETDTFVTIDGIDQTCTCNIDTTSNTQFGDPISTCIENFGSANQAQFQRPPTDGSGNSGSNNNNNNNSGSGDDGTCTIELPDGTTQEFQSGQELGDDVLPNNRCFGGADVFPCYCDPTAPGQIVCPYCRFPQSDGTLLCAVNGETVTFLDVNDESQECSCTIPSDPTADPIVNCNTGNNNNNNSSGPNRPDNNSNNNSNNDPNDVCTIEVEETGQFKTFQRGESFGEYLQTRCGNPIDFPCYCNPDLPMQMECPYCGFVTSQGDLICGKDGQTVTFESNVDDGSGQMETCLCQIPDEPGAEPIRTCGEGVTPEPTPIVGEDNNDGGNDVCTLLDFSGNEVTFQNGDSLGMLVEGVCGDSDDWPAFCNTDLVTATLRTTRQGGDIRNGIEYPYCVYTDTESGDPICARNNRLVTYTNTNGERIRCSCQYLSPGVGGGAQSQCEPVDGNNDNDNDSDDENSALPPFLTPPASSGFTATRCVSLLLTIVSATTAAMITST